MSVKIILPAPLRPYVGKRDAVQLEAQNVREALDALAREFAELRRHLFADDGRLRSFVNVYVNDEDIRYLAKEQTPLRDGDTISIVPSIAGGSTVHRSGGVRPGLPEGRSIDLGGLHFSSNDLRGDC